MILLVQGATARREDVACRRTVELNSLAAAKVGARALSADGPLSMSMSGGDAAGPRLVGRAPVRLHVLPEEVGRHGEKCEHGDKREKRLYARLALAGDEDVAPALGDLKVLAVVEVAAKLLPVP